MNKPNNVVAADVAAIRQAQARAHDAFMALPLNIPAPVFQHYADAVENLSTMTDIALLTRLTEEMQDLNPTTNADQVMSISAGLQSFMP